LLVNGPQPTLNPYNQSISAGNGAPAHDGGAAPPAGTSRPMGAALETLRRPGGLAAIRAFLVERQIQSHTRII
jgi:hypothetical protein